MISSRLGSGGSQFVRFSKDTWHGDALINRTLAVQGGSAPGTLLGSEGGGYIPTYGESLQAQVLQVPAYTMRYGGGAAMGDPCNPFSDDYDGYLCAEQSGPITTQEAHYVAENSSSSYDWNNFTTGILDVLGTAVAVGPEYIAALGKGTAAGTVQASSGGMTAEQMAAFQQAILLQSALPYQQQQEVSAHRDLWLSRYATESGVPQYSTGLNKAGNFFQAQAGGELTTNDILLYGALGLGALFLLTQQRRR